MSDIEPDSLLSGFAFAADKRHKSGTLSKKKKTLRRKWLDVETRNNVALA